MPCRWQVSCHREENGENMEILFVSLGCDKNLVDTEYMIGALRDAGHTFTNEEGKAQAIIINSCCFINDAKEESVNTILEMAEYKNAGSCKALIVTGCLAERYRSEIIKEIPEVDAVLGTNSYSEIVAALEEVQKGNPYELYQPLGPMPQMNARRSLTTGGHYAHLKIAEGCNKCCTYCIIPKIRGRYRSVPMEELLAQAKEFASQGVKELILVAQETTLYGVDLYGEKSLHKLLDELNKIPGIQWIRILYCYPEEIYGELVQSIKRNKKVCHYLDMPIQHINDGLLKQMGRRTTKEELRQKIAYLKEEIMELQEEIIFDKNDGMAGQELWVMVEGKVDGENAYIGRTYRDAPEIDGYIFVNTEETLVTGDFVKVNVTGAYGYDLIGEVVV